MTALLSRFGITHMSLGIGGIAIYRVEGDKLVQRWVEADLLGLFRTLGAAGVS